MFRRNHADGVRRGAVRSALALLTVLLPAVPNGNPHGSRQEIAPPADVQAAPLWCGRVTATADESEFHVRLRARAPGASWRHAGRESAALRVMVDGRYDQHLFLAAGDTETGYEFVTGPLEPGEHRLDMQWQREWSPGLTQPPELREVAVLPLRRSDPGNEPVFRAPTIYLRPDTVGRFTDVPLLLYWEREAAGRVVYTIILSNEDGGTDTERLMARWGRTTDIEWCYAYAVLAGVLEETYQGRDHETMRFGGAYDGLHPRLYDVTHNNIFSDQPAGTATVRVRPFPLFEDLNGKTRESVMDRHPWIYALMAQEMIREGKLEEPADAESVRVSDLRNYAYVEACARQDGTELSFEVLLRGGESWYSSHHGDPKARVGRSGCFRSSVELPGGTDASRIGALRIACFEAPPPKGQKRVPKPQARLDRIGPVFLLEENYQPGPPVKLERRASASLEPGDSLVLSAP